MGWFTSSEEDTGNVVDANGQVNKNIIIQEAKDTHEQVKLSARRYAMYEIWAKYSQSTIIKIGKMLKSLRLP